MAKRFRDYNLALLFIAVSALLSVVFVSQWLHYRHQRTDLKKLLATKVEARMEDQGVEEQHFELPSLEEYSATVERPLFMEGRRPATVEANEPEAAPVEKKPLAVKLMGVVFAPKETLGLFVDAQGKYKRLRINDSIGGWKVEGIEADKAIMEQDGAKEELKLAKPKQKKGPGQPKPGGPMGGPPPFGQPGVPGQQVPPFGAVNPNNPNMPEPPFDSEQPNDPVDETAIPPEEPQYEQ
ncbi:MAG: hypothetical protein NTX45_04025 [Proteobacteria bacterium]|nr:hypothetical protein [Pseudomonadota bacterium]